MAIDGITSSSSATASSRSPSNDTAAMQDRFLKLLVAQINNQDPLNPMDNAQMTTQMAQINTVSGIQQVNQTLQGMASQFASMQVLQAASLVGHEVLLPGSALTRDPATGMASSAFDLGGNASQVKIEVLSPVGQVLGTINSGAMTAGRHSFSWDASAYANYPTLNYRIAAVNGQQSVAATPYTTDKVLAVGSANGTVSVDLQSGKSVPYSSITAIL
ncbi:MAG: flagellar hook assembly protein FlgD [Burkholderiales bacterium]|nr:flagellar hook assembly protein FlgD [Burkholderiales bacterium]